MSSVAGPQLINTASSSGQSSPLSDRQTALWVGAWMVIGLAGLLVIGVIFRKHVEI